MSKGEGSSTDFWKTFRQFVTTISNNSLSVASEVMKYARESDDNLMMLLEGVASLNDVDSDGFDEALPLIEHLQSEFTKLLEADEDLTIRLPGIDGVAVATTPTTEIKGEDISVDDLVTSKKPICPPVKGSWHYEETPTGFITEEYEGTFLFPENGNEEAFMKDERYFQRGERVQFRFVQGGPLWDGIILNPTIDGKKIHIYAMFNQEHFATAPKLVVKYIKGKDSNFTDENLPLSPDDTLNFITTQRWSVKQRMIDAVFPGLVSKQSSSNKRQHHPMTPEGLFQLIFVDLFVPPLVSCTSQT